MFPDKNYTLGRGELYFAPFIPGTTTPAGPQEYFGNTTEINLTSESEMLDHYDSDHGIRTKDDSVQLELNRTGTFITDHISPKNLAKWFAGVAQKVTQVLATAQTFAIVDVQRGGRYQIGVTVGNPSGLRGLSAVSAVKEGSPDVTLVVNVDYTIDVETGGFVVLDTSAVVADGDDVTVTYTADAISYNQIKSGSVGSLDGQLFYKSFNPRGAKFDYFFPKVTLSPDGDMALKGDDWQTLPFTFEALKLDDETEVVYTNGRPGVFV